MTAAGAALAACQPQTVIVEKEVEKVVKETVEVEKEKVVEKEVTKVVEKEVTKVVEKEKVVTATPLPPSQYGEAPQWGGLVAQGKLPPIDERLPVDALVISPIEEVGQYGGTWHRMASGPGDLQLSARLTYETFIRFNHFGTDLVPNMAKSWEANADSSVYTIYLRKGVRWADGEMYTADDLLFWMEDRLGNDEITPGKPKWLMPHGELATVTKMDDWTVQFEFHGPYGLFPTFNAYSFGLDLVRETCKHYLQQFHVNYVDKANIEKMATDAGFEQWYQLYSNKENMQTNPDLPVVSAWKIDLPAPKQPVVAASNPYYWKVDTEGNQLPYIDKIEWMVVSGGDIINLRAASGEIDMQLRHITFDNYPIFKENEEVGDYRVLEWKWGENETVVHFTQDSIDPVKKPILEDKRFRFALSLAADRQEIVDAVYYGTVEPSQLVPYPTSPWWTEERANFMAEYDPDRANDYLDEMGLTERDADGYRLMSNGERLVIFWDYAPIFGAWKPIGELLTAHYQKIGVELVLKEEARPLFYEHFRARETDLALWTGHSTFFPILAPRDFAAISYGGTKWGAQYARWWETGGVDGVEPPPDGDIRKSQILYDEALTAPSQDEAFEIFDELVENFYNNLWVMGFTTPPIQPVIVKNSFRNVPDGVLSTWSLLSPGATAPEQYFFKQD
jgi:peptide/nickel transport system substrate-binding protein